MSCLRRSRSALSQSHIFRFTDSLYLVLTSEPTSKISWSRIPGRGEQVYMSDGLLVQKISWRFLSLVGKSTIWFISQFSRACIMVISFLLLFASDTITWPVYAR